MMGSFQRQSRLRKLIYAGLIVVLFTLNTFLVRGSVGKPPKWTAASQADALKLREQNLGEVELPGSTIRLFLTGSRGVVVCALWLAAGEKKLKEEWNELELIIRSLTKLQPHFIEPWEFQSWELSYNVFVDTDFIKDKYYYLTRGMELLAEGVRRNRDNPDLRRELGWYYQHKIGHSDQHNALRSLFQMSAIDPRERDPKRFRRLAGDRSAVDLEYFENFCKDHPFLVRRLKDTLRCDKPEKVVEFLEEYQRIPSLFEETSSGVSSPKKPLAKRFPMLPPRSKYEPQELTPDSDLSDEIDNFAAARSWFGYSQDPTEDWIEEGDRKDLVLQFFSWILGLKEPEKIKEKVKKLRHKPRRLALVLFQEAPPRAQSYVPEFQQTEGWFDQEGWTIKDWFPKDRFQNGQPARVGAGRNWSEEAWGKTHKMFTLYGEKPREEGKPPEQIRHLMTPEELERLSDKGRTDQKIELQMTNFNHFYYQSKIDKMPEAVAARKHFHWGDQLKRTDPRLAVREYEHPSAFGPPQSWRRNEGWKKIMLDNKELREDVLFEEVAYKHVLKYLEAEKELFDGIPEQLKLLLVVGNLLNVSTSVPSPAALAHAAWPEAPGFSVPFQGPLEDVDEDGKPLISVQARAQAMRALEIAPAKPRAPVDKGGR